MLIQVKRWITRRSLVHCWADGDGSTCMRAWGHLGAHEFVPDSEITMAFTCGDQDE